MGARDIKQEIAMVLRRFNEECRKEVFIYLSSKTYKVLKKDAKSYGRNNVYSQSEGMIFGYPVRVVKRLGLDFVVGIGGKV